MSAMSGLLAALQVDDVMAQWRDVKPDTRDKLILFAAIGLVLAWMAVWAVFFRKSHRRRPHRHHHEHHSSHAPRSRQAAGRGGALLRAPDKRRRRRRRAAGHRPRNPTLAETGGLPPVRAGRARPRPSPEPCKRAGRSRGRARRIWRWRSSCCPGPSATACPPSMPSAARWMTWRMTKRSRSPQRRAQLAAWRADVRRACGTETPQFPVNRELQPVIRQYHLPFEHFDALLQGVEMDLDIKRYEDYDAAGALLLSRRVRRRLAEHRGLRLPGPGLPRVRRVPRQGAATDQHPARCALGRRARPDLSAASPSWRVSRCRPRRSCGWNTLRASANWRTAWPSAPGISIGRPARRCPRWTAARWSPPS